VVTQSAFPGTVCLPLPEVAQPKVEVKQAYCIDPLVDPRWDFFLECHSRASVFHSTAWLSALSRTYGYKPVVFTTTPVGEDLENAIVFCQVESALTGRRLVSLPFSDHCDPLVDREDDLRLLSAALDQESSRERWRYVETRALTPFTLITPLLRSEMRYTFHQVDLSPAIATIFNRCHKNSIQRKIRRAEREGLTCMGGSNAELLDRFYELFTVTRKRHRLPPPPSQWFSNLIDCFGDDLKIRVAAHKGTPVSAIITLRHKDTLVYKYGGCDSRFTNLGSMHFLLWNAIAEAKESGLRWFDLGRTDADQHGLITFKNRWGAAEAVVTYSRYSSSEQCTHMFDLSTPEWKTRAAKYVLEHLPTGVLSTIGRLLYGHVG
jgi:CelD/BcsL family acetyltransferase involved in cellulose biosynthesis